MIHLFHATVFLASVKDILVYTQMCTFVSSALEILWLCAI